MPSPVPDRAIGNTKPAYSDWDDAAWDGFRWGSDDLSRAWDGFIWDWGGVWWATEARWDQFAWNHLPWFEDVTWDNENWDAFAWQPTPVYWDSETWDDFLWL